MRILSTIIGLVALAAVSRHHAYLPWLLGAAAGLWMGARTLASRYFPAAGRARGAAAERIIPAEAARRLSEAGLGDTMDGVHVGVTGRVECEGPLVSPFSGTTCAAYRLDVEVSAGLGLMGPRWVSSPPVQQSVPFTIRDGDAEMSVLAEGARLELRQGAARRFSRAEALRSPLEELVPALDAVADREAGSFRVREGTLAVGTTAHVWGTLAGSDDGIALGRAPVEGGEAFVISDAPAGQLRLRFGEEKKRALRMVAVYLAAAALLGWRGAGLWHTQSHRAKMYVRNATAKKVTVRLCSGRPEDGIWNYDPYEASSKTLGTYLTDKSRTVLIAPGDRLTVAEWRASALSVLLGSGAVARWDPEGNCWSLDLAPASFQGEGAVAAASRVTKEDAGQPLRQGQVYVRNVSRRVVKISYKPKGAGAAPGYWTFQPGRGRDKPHGVRLLDGKSPQVAATGDCLVLGIADAGTAAVRLGDGKAASWRGDDNSWLLTLDDSLAEARAGVLRVRNRTDWGVRLSARRPDGVTYGSHWSFGPHEGADSARGTTLQVSKEDVLFRGEDRIDAVAMVPAAERSLVVGRTPEPVWRPHERCWLLDLKEGARP